MSAAVAVTHEWTARGLTLPTKVREALATLPANFTGKIELNCFEGGVGNMNVLWSVKTGDK